MDSLADIRRGFTSPKALLRGVNRFYHTRAGRYDHNPRGTSIFDEEWDNLVILDACRYDYFEDLVDFPGRLDYRWSLGSNTREFTRANFRGRRLHDTVYLTANSWYLRLREDLKAELHKVVDLHMGDEGGEYHDERFNIVPPDVLTDRAKRIVEEFPNKRLLIHYIQPHHPFLGPTGRKYFDYPSSALQEVVARAEGATVEDVHQAYRENVEIVLDSVVELLDALPGRTVITADHGEMLGERHEFIPIRDFGHQMGIYNEVLTKVPWFVLENGHRKRVAAEPPRDGLQEVDVSRLERRLEELGYKM